VDAHWSQSSRERKFARTFVPGSERAGHFSLGSESSRERNGLGANGPGSELARVLLADSLTGANGPVSEKAVNLFIYWAKKQNFGSL